MLFTKTISEYVHLLLINVQLLLKLPPKYVYHLSFYVHLFLVFTALIGFHMIQIRCIPS